MHNPIQEYITRIKSRILNILSFSAWPQNVQDCELVISQDNVAPVIQFNNHMVGHLSCSKLKVHNSVLSNLSGTFQSLVV